MDLQKLKIELSTDPLGRYAGMTTSQKVTSLNTSDRNRYVPITSADLLAWSADKGRMQSIKDACDDVNQTNEIRSICRASLILIQRDGTKLEPGDSAHLNMIMALVGAGVITTADKNELVVMASQVVSRAEELGLEVVEEKHIRWAEGLDG